MMLMYCKFGGFVIFINMICEIPEWAKPALFRF